MRMLDFEIYLYPNKDDNIDDSLDSLEEDILFLIKQNMLEKNPKKNKVLNNIWSGNYRGALALIDGTSRNKIDDLISIQRETKTLFSNKELEIIFNIITNTALLGPRDPEVLWEYLGHRILYEELCKKPVSLFSKPVNEQLKPILENGAFWETTTLTFDNSFQWYEKNLKFVENFLSKDYSKINIFQGERGLESALRMISMGYLYTSRKKDTVITPSILLSDFNYDAINNYYLTIKELYNNKERLNLNEEDIGVLLIPRLVYDFENEIIFDDENELNLNSNVLSDPFMIKMLKNSECLKISFAEYLINDDYDGIDSNVYEALKEIPCKNDILEIAGELLMQDAIIKSPENNKPYYYERFVKKYDKKNSRERAYYYPSIMELFKYRIN